jgi:fructose-specific phosphotransferase system IIA component
MALLDRISSKVIKVPLQAQTKDAAIRELVQVLVDAGTIQDPEATCDAVLAREALGSTGLENGLAVPHAKTTAVTDLAIAIGISPKGVEFSALDGQPSHLLFLLIAPPDKSGPHIEALAEIARLTRSPVFTRVLRAAANAEEAMSIFRE